MGYILFMRCFGKGDNEYESYYVEDLDEVTVKRCVMHMMKQIRTDIGLHVDDDVFHTKRIEVRAGGILQGFIRITHAKDPDQLLQYWTGEVLLDIKYFLDEVSIFREISEKKVLVRRRTCRSSSIRKQAMARCSPDCSW